MNKLKLAVNSFVQDESGQDLIEYALVAALIGLGAIASLNSLKSAISGAFTNITKQLSANNGS